MEGLSFQIETIRTPYESVLLGSQVYHLKAQPTCVWCPPTSVSLSLYIKECLGQATAWECSQRPGVWDNNFRLGGDLVYEPKKVPTEFYRNPPENNSKPQHYRKTEAATHRYRVSLSDFQFGKTSPERPNLRMLSEPGFWRYELPAWHSDEQWCWQHDMALDILSPPPTLTQ